MSVEDVIKTIGKNDLPCPFPQCVAPEPMPPWLCTRWHGHRGDHIARGVVRTGKKFGAIMARWPRG